MLLRLSYVTGLLMDDVNFFDKMDLKEVAKKTLISIRDLEYLKNEEFDKLSKTKGLGFIKILEREYKIDLGYKKEKFLEYLKEEGKDTTKEFFIAPPKPPVKTFSKLIALILFILIGVGILYILYLNSGYDASSSQATSDENRVIKEAQDISGIEVNETNITEENTFENTRSESNTTETNTITSVMESQETNTSTVSDTKTEPSKDTQKEKAIATKPKEETVKESLPQQEQISNDTVDINESIPIDLRYTLTIVPKNRIWVGVVDLKNHKKKSYLKDTNITIEKSDSYMIATGHGEFKLYYKGEVLDFNTKNPIRFLIKDGNLTQINKKEFIKLNRGKYW